MQRLTGDSYPAEVLSEYRLIDSEMRPISGSRHRYIGEHEGSETGLRLSDEFWGDTFIPDSEADGLWTALFHHNAAIRLQGIPNLTMPDFGSIIPGTHDMSRWEHAWGSVVLTRRLIEKHEHQTGEVIEDNEKLHLQLRTFLSDFGHTIGSHLGDWVKQGFGGPENAHDETLKAYLERCGIANLLRVKGVELDDVVFPDMDGGDFIEKDAPDLCVDRVDWSVRQICGRFLGRKALSGSIDLTEEFTLYRDDSDQLQMACVDTEFATKYAGAFALLVSEHFNHPIHNYLLRLYGAYLEQSLAYDSLAGNMTHDAFRKEFHPHDLLYLVDLSMLNPERLAFSLSKNTLRVIADIARPQRENYTQRRITLEKLIGSLATGQTVDFPTQSIVAPDNSEASRVIISDAGPESVTQNLNPFAPNFLLSSLKPRSIDPPVLTDTGVRPVSSLMPNLTPFLEGQKETLGRAYVTS